VIEAFESTQHPYLIGTQWHPELAALGDARQRRLFEALLARPAAARSA
jgi:gamma-glutamyl-gamma-aminobutyrate hydrolase PuuD